MSNWATWFLIGALTTVVVIGATNHERYERDHAYYHHDYQSAYDDGDYQPGYSHFSNDGR